MFWNTQQACTREAQQHGASEVLTAAVLPKVEPDADFSAIFRDLYSSGVGPAAT